MGYVEFFFQLSLLPPLLASLAEGLKQRKFSLNKPDSGLIFFQNVLIKNQKLNGKKWMTKIAWSKIEQQKFAIEKTLETIHK